MDDPDSKRKRPSRDDESDLTQNENASNKDEYRRLSNLSYIRLSNLSTSLKLTEMQLSLTIDIVERLNLIKSMFDLILANIDIVNPSVKLHFHMKINEMASEIALECPEHSNVIDFERYRAALGVN